MDEVQQPTDSIRSTYHNQLDLLKLGNNKNY